MTFSFENLERRRLLSASSASRRVAAAPAPASAIALKAAAAVVARPGLILSPDDLAAVKANLNNAPWKSAYAELAADSHSKLTYAMQGPFADVSRNPDVNLNQYKNDMQAIYNLALMFTFTGNAAYAQKSHDILLAWSTTHTSLSGAEAPFSAGDYIYRSVGGADVLRGSWSGWTQGDTDATKAYFSTVYYQPGIIGLPGPLRSANQGALSLVIAVAVASYLDDPAKLQDCLKAYRTDVLGGLGSSLPNGEIGDTGRDQGHAYGMIEHLAQMAEMFWRQGIDVYGELDNRLLAIGEFYARTNLRIATPYVPFGTAYDYYPTIGGTVGTTPEPDFAHLLYNAYVVRKGMSAPYLTQYRDQQVDTADSFVYRRAGDASTATPPTPAAGPAPTQSLTRGLTDAAVGSAAAGGGATYANGTWSLAGSGSDIYDSTNNFQFAYRAVTGDVTIVARITSQQNTAWNAKAGLMIRESLAGTGAMMDVVMEPGKSGPVVQSFLRGQTASNNNLKALEHDLVSVPQWLKLERVGNRIYAFHSADGASWTAVHGGEFAMPGTIYVGLALSTAASTFGTATFTDVRVTGGDGLETPKLPAAPAAIYASPGDGRVPLRWLESFGATSYTVKRAATAGGPFAPIATVGGTSFVDAAVANGATYDYVVTASNGVGESAPSAADVGAPLAPIVYVDRAIGGTATASPAGSATESAANAFDLKSTNKWYGGGTAGTGTIQYDFGPGKSWAISRYDVAAANDLSTRDPAAWTFEASNNGTAWTTLDARTGQDFPSRYGARTYLVANATAYRYYRLNISATVSGTDGVQISELRLLTANPAAPANLLAAPAASNRIELSWTDQATTETGFTIERATDSTFTTNIMTATAGANAKTFSATGLTSRTAYYFRVRATNASGSSADSNVAGATTPDVRPVSAMFAVDDGTMQRSMVRSLTVTFAEFVSLGAGALDLKLTSGATPATVPYALTPLGGNSYRLSFAGTAGAIGGSLADGVYRLSVNGPGVTGADGATFGGATSLAFHRLFGDSDGDADVDNTDALRFRLAQGTTSAQPAYRAAFDFDADGDIDNTDALNSSAAREPR